MGKLYVAAPRKTGATATVRISRPPRKPGKRGTRPYLMSAGRCPLITPRTQIARLRYALSDGITSTAGGIGLKEFRANGLYDPDYTAAGHQPRGFDQWMAMFDHFTVLSAKIHAVFTPITALTNTVGVNLILRDDYTAPGNLDQIYESRIRKNGWLLPGQARPVFMNMSVNIKKFFNIKSLMGLSRFQGTQNADPTEQLAFQCTAMDFNSGTVTIGLYGYIDYYVCFTEPKQLPES